MKYRVMSGFYTRKGAKGNQWIKHVRSSLKICFTSYIFCKECHIFGDAKQYNKSFLQKEVGDLARLKQLSLSHPNKSEVKGLLSTVQAQKQLHINFKV